jgi:hypothetical protein
MVARGRGGRLAEADATEGVRSAAWQVGGGTLICLDLPQQEDWSGADPRRPSDESTPFQMNSVADLVAATLFTPGERRTIGRDVRDLEAAHVLPLVWASAYVHRQRLLLRLLLDLAHLRIVG